MNMRSLVRRAAMMVVIGSVSVFSMGSVRADEPGVPPNGKLPDGVFRAHTVASEQRGMNFNSPGVVIKMMVMEGDFVKKGQALAEQDSRVEEADMKVQEVDANSDLQITAAQKQWDESKVELSRDEQMYKQHVIGEFDLYKARLEVDIGEARYKLAIQERATAGLKVEEAKARIAQKKLFATTDGIVLQIGVNEGELTSNDPKNPVVTIVTNDPLYVEADLPTAEAKMLEAHQKVQVSYTDDPGHWLAAEVFSKKAVATATASSQKIRFQLENSKGLPSGLNMLLKLRDKVAPAPAAR